MKGPRSAAAVSAILSRHFRNVSAASAVVSLPTRTNSCVPNSISTLSARGGISDAGIAGDRDPPAPTNLSNPLLIEGFRSEMIVVLFDLQSRLTERCGKLSTKISICEKYELTQSVHRRAHP
jgi:hypothetical protein